MAKHWLAVMSYINTGMEGPNGVEESIHDIQNYLDLLLAMVEETRNE